MSVVLLYWQSASRRLKYETWTIYRRHIQSLDKFHLRCLRQTTGIKWQDKIPNTEVLAHCKMTKIEAMLVRTLLWPSSSLSDTRFPKAIFYSQLASGNRPMRPCGHPVKGAWWRKTYSCATSTQQPGKQLHKIDRRGEAPASQEYPISNINASQTCNWREERGRLVSQQLLCLTTVPSVVMDVLPPSDSTRTRELTSADCSSVNLTEDSNNLISQPSITDYLKLLEINK